ncbi:MAG: hypothetical protein K6E59_03215 [Bacilli bacterium]|nr:hypothetical protein [Bacilli bacterium]
MEQRKTLRVSYFLYGLLSAVFLFFAAVAYRMPQYRYVENPPFESDSVFFGILIGEALLGLVLIVVGHIAFHKRPNWILLVLCTVLFAGSVTGLSAETLSGFPLYNGAGYFVGQPTDYLFVFSSAEKVRYACCYFLTLETLYFLIGVLPHLGKGKHVWILTLTGIVIGVLVLCVYSYIAEWHIYAHYLQGGAHERPDHACVSLPGERHFWGMALMIGTFACGIGYGRTKAAWWFIPMGLFLATSFFSFAKVEITAIVIFDVLFIGYACISGWKRHRVTAICCLVFLAALGAVAALVIANVQLPGLSALRSYYELMIENAETMTGRTDVWEKFFFLLNHQPSAYVFGFGDYLPNYVISYAKPGYGWFHCHNAWLEMISHGGILRLAIYGCAAAWFLFLVGKGLFYRKQKGYVPVVFVCLAYALVSAAEFLNPLETDVYGIMLFLVVIMPVLHDEVSAKKGELGEALLVNDDIRSPNGLGVFDGLILALAFAAPASFSAYSAGLGVLAFALELCLICVTGLLKGKEAALPIALAGIVSCALLFSVSSAVGSERYGWTAALLLGYAPLIAGAYAFKAHRGYADSWFLYLGETFCAQNDAFRRAREENDPTPRFL